MAYQMASNLGTYVRIKQPYDVALERTKTALKSEGFGVLTEIDVKETLRKKLGVEFRRYIILGACNPPLAHRALTTDLEVGLLLPCNVVVYEVDAGESVVGLLNPTVMSDLLSDPNFILVAKEAQERFNRVASALRDG